MTNIRTTLKQLRAFDAIARTGSVTAAAEDISLTQSATSLSLRELEYNLNVQLFDRGGKRLVLNQNGLRLQPYVQAVLRQTRELGALFEDSPSGLTELRIAASESIGNHLIPKCVGEINATSPNLRIHMQIGSEERIVNLVESRAVDLAFVEGVTLRSALWAYKWTESPVIIFVSPQHHLANTDNLTFIDLKEEEWVLQRRDSYTRLFFARILLEHLETLKISVETNGIEAIKEIVKSGQGIGCLPKMAVQNELDRGDLCEVTVSGFSLKCPLSIVKRKDTLLGERNKAVIEQIIGQEINGSILDGLENEF